MNGDEILEDFAWRLSQFEAFMPRLDTLPRLPSPPEDLRLLTSYQGTPAVFPASWIANHQFRDFNLLASDLRGLLTGVLQVDVFRLQYGFGVYDAQELSASRSLSVKQCPMMRQDLQLENGQGKDYLSPIPSTKIESMDFGTFLSEFSLHLKSNHNQLLYLALRTLPEKSSPSSMPTEFCHFIDNIIYPITRLKFMTEGTIKQINLWMGAIVTSRIHFDALDNIHICLSGKKILHLYSPLELPNLYPEPWDKDQLNSFSSIGSAIMANHVKHTRFFENATCIRMELNSGEAIFIPAGWWHEVFTLQPSVSVNLWFGPSLNARFRPTLMHLKSENYLQFMLERM